MGESKESKSVSVEDLKMLVSQLQQQNKFLIEQIQKNNDASFYKRLDYLFEVIKASDKFDSVDDSFVNKCISEEVGVMTIPEVDGESDGNSEKSE